ncbi:MAG: Crp/Fnr family transcriptional regulator [Nitrosomonadales bacterium]|nr:Crp/Fnr family transcriptional regulator [Nitrosomonadales bacterium]
MQHFAIRRASLYNRTSGLEGIALTNPVKIPALLAHLPLFCELSADEIGRIARGSREQQLARGDMLFRRGDPCNGFYVVIHGRIKLALTSPQGIEKVVELIGPGQSFGEAVMFMDKPYPVFAQALTDTLVLHIGKQVIAGEIDSDPVFCRKMLAGLSIRLHRLIQTVESISLRSPAQRVIDYLLQGLDEIKEGLDVQVSLTANKNVIASNLNVTPETFSRILRNLSDAGLIKVDGKDVCISDIARLRAYEE